MFVVLPPSFVAVIQIINGYSFVASLTMRFLFQLFNVILYSVYSVVCLKSSDLKIFSSAELCLVNYTFY